MGWCAAAPVLHGDTRRARRPRPRLLAHTHACRASLNIHTDLPATVFQLECMQVECDFSTHRCADRVVACGVLKVHSAASAGRWVDALVRREPELRRARIVIDVK